MSTCGVYIVRDAAAAPIYVGSSAKIEERLREHAKRAAWWPEGVAVEIREVTPRAAAYIVESELIREHQPRHNIRYRMAPKCASRLAAGTPVVKPRLEGWGEVIGEYGSDTAAARALSISPQTFSNIKRGAYFPSAKFIATALSVTGRSFDDLFVVGEREADEENVA